MLNIASYLHVFQIELYIKYTLCKTYNSVEIYLRYISNLYQNLHKFDEQKYLYL